MTDNTTTAITEADLDDEEALMNEVAANFDAMHDLYCAIAEAEAACAPFETMRGALADDPSKAALLAEIERKLEATADAVQERIRGGCISNRDQQMEAYEQIQTARCIINSEAEIEDL